LAGPVATSSSLKRGAIPPTRSTRR
jgi:hypothetical protein